MKKQAKFKTDFEYHYNEKAIQIVCSCKDVGLDWIEGLNFVAYEDDEMIPLTLDELEMEELELACMENLMNHKERVENGLEA